MHFNDKKTICSIQMIFFSFWIKLIIKYSLERKFVNRNSNKILRKRNYSFHKLFRLKQFTKTQKITFSYYLKKINF